MRSVLALVTCAVLPLESSCGLSCNLMLPSCSFTATVEGLEPGVYEVTASFSGRSVHCTALVPAPQPSSAESASIGCDDPGVTVSGQGMWLENVGHQNDPLRIRIATTDELRPERVALRIRRNGAIVLDRTIKQGYDVTEPNGPGCGECANASATVAP